METAVSGWFTIIESQFHLRNITQEVTKFYHIISALPATVVAQLPQTVLLSQNYAELKLSVESMFTKTKGELFDQLMNPTSLTGRPSVYMREMMSKASQIEIGNDIVKHKFLQILPPAIAPVLACQKDLELHQLGSLADSLLPLLGKESAMTVNKFDNNPTFLTHEQPMSTQSESHYNECNPTQVQHINRQQRSMNQSYFSNHSDCSNIPIGLRPYSKNQLPKVCRSHLYFGETARNCKAWCKWPNKQNGSVQPNSRPSSPNRNQNQGN